MPDPTTNYGWDLPNNNADEGTWGLLLIAIFNDLDTLVWGNLPRDGSRPMTGQLDFATTTSALAPISLPAGSADPTAPAAGELWNNGHRLKYRNASATKSLAFLDDDITGNAATASKWKDARTLTLAGEATGSVVVDGSENETLTVTLDEPSVLAKAWEPGDVKMAAGSTVPTGWLECNGAAVSRTSYAALFAAIGTVYGVGDGTTTFNLPDLRGEFVRGWDHSRGIDAGRALGSAQTDALQNITGNVGTVFPTVAGSSSSGDVNATGAFQAGTKRDVYSAAGADAFDVSFDASRVARTSTETRPRNIALMFLIKT